MPAKDMKIVDVYFVMMFITRLAVLILAFSRASEEAGCPDHR